MLKVKPMKLTTLCAASLMAVSAVNGAAANMVHADVVKSDKTVSVKDLSSLLDYAKSNDMQAKSKRANKQTQTKFDLAVKNASSIVKLFDAKPAQVTNDYDKLNSAINKVDIDVKSGLRQSIAIANSALNGMRDTKSDNYLNISKALSGANSVNNDVRSNLESIDNAKSILDKALASAGQKGESAGTGKTDSNKANANKDTDVNKALSGKDNGDLNNAKDSQKDGQKDSQAAKDSAVTKDSDNKNADDYDSDTSNQEAYEALQSNLKIAKSTDFQLKANYGSKDNLDKLNNAIINANKLNKNSKKADLDKANTNLVNAMTNIDKLAKRALDESITEARGVMKTNSFKDADEETKSALTNAMYQAQLINDDLSASVTDISLAQAAVEKAMLDAGNYTDKDSLQDLTNLSENMQNMDFLKKADKQSVNELDEALHLAKGVLDKKDATNTDVSQAASRLRRALIASLVSAGANNAKNGKAKKSAAGSTVYKITINGAKKNKKHKSGDNAGDPDKSKKSGKSKKDKDDSDADGDNAGDPDSDSSSSHDSEKASAKREGALPQTGHFIMQHAKAICGAIGAVMVGLLGYLVYDNKRKNKEKE